MITEILTVEQLKEIFTEALFNKTNKVTKISPGSVLNGISYGSGKLGQKTLKDVAVIEAHLFPDSAVGIYLDRLASLRGVAPRLSATKSSTYIRLVGEPGTIYQKGTQTFTGNPGIVFDLEETVTIDTIGFAYAKIRSQVTGVKANVEPLTMAKVVPVPVGHLYCINEYGATGGVEDEDDDTFRKRIKEEINLLATKTISFITQVFRKINPNILRVFNLGLDANGDINIGVAAVNGMDFNQAELDELLYRGDEYFSLNELKPDGLNTYGIKIVNIPYYPIDVSCRVDILNNFNPEDVRKEIQLNLNKTIDNRFFNYSKDEIEWINLFETVRTTTGINKCLDNFFYPMVNQKVPRGYLPRFRGFTMLDLSGNIISNITGTLNPIFYPAQADFGYQDSILKSI